MCSFTVWQGNQKLQGSNWGRQQWYNFTLGSSDCLNIKWCWVPPKPFMTPWKELHHSLRRNPSHEKLSFLKSMPINQQWREKTQKQKNPQCSMNLEGDKRSQVNFPPSSAEEEVARASRESGKHPENPLTHGQISLLPAFLKSESSSGNTSQIRYWQFRQDWAPPCLVSSLWQAPGGSRPGGGKKGKSWNIQYKVIREVLPFNHKLLGKK